MEKGHKNLMKNSTFSFLVDTLYEEIMMHPHKDELLTLMDAQVADDTWLQNLIECYFLVTRTIRIMHDYHFRKCDWCITWSASL